uniref:Uncharacterized protein n=1 Tax=uncultured prokaryote TaxID=198431 RepID=A0A0H5PYV5_9ZZZZ|nr:hypothetical protein [uncultured prokaryote]
MLIKFTGGGRGGGRQVAEYLTREEGRGHAPPEVVRGDMDRTRDLVDSIDRQWTYTHGVLSFAAEDAPTEDQQREAMDMFERLAFAGLDPEQYDITWVRHSHTESGRTELHFVTPRMELCSGRALNIAPPGWESTYAPLRDALNLSHGWARPDDPERAQELTQAPERAQEGFLLREGREGIHAYLTALVASQSVTDRASMMQAIREAGLEVTREGKDYITVQDPESDERFRMKGRIYERGWTYDRELDRAIAPARGLADSRSGNDLESRTLEAFERYQAAVDRRASQNSERYHRNQPAHQHGPDRVEMGQSVLVDRADRDLADRGRLVDLALNERERGQSRTNEPERLPDLHAGRAEISDRADRQRSGDVSEGRDGGGLRPATARGVIEDERQADHVRAGLAGSIRAIGDRLRAGFEGLGDRLKAFGASFLGHREAIQGNSREGATVGASLGRADEAHRGLAGAVRELGAAGERIAARVAEVMQEREVRERAERYRTRDRGDDYGL